MQTDKFQWSICYDHVFQQATQYVSNIPVFSIIWIIVMNSLQQKILAYFSRWLDSFSQRGIHDHPSQKKRQCQRPPHFTRIFNSCRNLQHKISVGQKVNVSLCRLFSPSATFRIICQFKITILSSEFSRIHNFSKKNERTPLMCTAITLHMSFGNQSVQAST